MTDDLKQLHAAPETIYLQVDPEGIGPSEWDTLDGATWCADQINDSDVRYVRADRIEQLEVERDEAASAVRRLSEGQPFDAVVIADTVKRRTAQLEAERDELLACLNLLYSWANNWDSEFMNDPEWINKDGPRIKAAISKPKGQDNDNNE